MKIPTNIMKSKKSDMANLHEKMKEENLRIHNLEVTATNLHALATSTHDIATDAFKRGTKDLDLARKELRISKAGVEKLKEERDKARADANRLIDQQASEKTIKELKDQELKRVSGDLAALKRKMVTVEKEL